MREARAAAQLRHPGIVSVREVGREDDTVYIVSDFVDGVTLADWLTAQKPTAREAAELCIQIAEALHHAHEAGVIHRDLKPSNILLAVSDQRSAVSENAESAGSQTLKAESRKLTAPIITDFGLASLPTKCCSTRGFISMNRLPTRNGR